MAGLECLEFRYPNQRARGAEKGMEKLLSLCGSGADSQFPERQSAKIHIRTEATNKTCWYFP